MWLSKLGQTSETSEAREQHGQLQSILDFYGKKHQSGYKATIDWDAYKEDIHTEGVVDKI